MELQILTEKYGIWLAMNIYEYLMESYKQDHKVKYMHVIKQLYKINEILDIFGTCTFGGRKLKHIILIEKEREREKREIDEHRMRIKRGSKVENYRK